MVGHIADLSLQVRSLIDWFGGPDSLVLLSVLLREKGSEGKGSIDDE
jgi:hypothetical protein